MAHLPGHSEAAVSEYRTDTGELRPLYADVMAALDGMGDEGMRQRWRQAKREVALDAFSFALDPKEFRPVPSDWFHASLILTSGRSSRRAWSKE